MHLSLRKTLSRLRPLSDASSIEHVSRRHSSMSEVEELLITAYGSHERPEKCNRARAFSESDICSPRAISSSYTPRPFYISSPLSMAPTLDIPERQTGDFLLKLQRENRALRNENTYLKFEAQVREDELKKFRSKYCTEKFKVSSNYEFHVDLVSSETLAPSVLRQPTLRRSKDIPAANSLGPSSSLTTPGIALSPDINSYVAPVDSKRNTKYTKGAATLRADNLRPNLFGRATVSHTSSAANVVTGPGGLRMDNQLKRLKAGSVQHTPSPASVRNANVTPRSTARSAYTPVLRPSHKHCGKNLAPLTSQTPKDEVRSRFSPGMQRFPTKTLRSALSDVDIYHSGSRVPTQQSVENLGTQMSTKAMGKRRAIVLDRTPLDSTANSKNVRDVHLQLDSVLCALESHHLPPPTPIGFVARTLDDQGTLLAEKALLSLERICSGFSSGSLGSLDSGNELLTTEDVPSFFVVDTTIGGNKVLTLRSKSASGPGSPSFSRQSIKTSTPLVSRFRPSLFSISQFRPVAASSPKARPARPSRKHNSPLRLSKAKGPLTPTMSSTKKFVPQYTSPLRISKKGGSTSIRPLPRHSV
ncbi:hypothetical protein H0H87_004116 [Tephrocybe sp. NHM501043]|nr:hypothetical protein H0H87_004116 [Tephrocybe sp. NHM501043]